MTLGYFEYGGKKSTDFGLLIDAEISFSSPQVTGEFVDIDGQDGQPFLTDSKLKNVSKSFPVYLERQDHQAVATEISNWLKADVGWKNLSFSGDPDYYYEAIYTDEYEIKTLLDEYGQAILTFSCKPYKFLKSGQSVLTSPANLTNPTKRNARPLITIKGTGNITLTIGTEKITLKAVDGGVVIDCLKEVVTNLAGTAAAWDKVTSYPLPVIKPGKQAVLTTGTITELKIVPRWEVIV